MAKGFYIVKEWDNTHTVAYIQTTSPDYCKLTYTEDSLSVTRTVEETRAMIVRDALQSEITI